ncbi:MAG: succinate dehydrogenase assembly factor 2 [Pseudomonadota bacterium]|nr:succinate dehydrogenase assembly factor 2 [Pseudomonadota bacterium]MED5341996.1 succinate dehydrogenase assembly factor 2 [Pseudomonadota bacterium]MED5346682.1 succinate dehydrogenase assembly factor 2 [Pseudomonadota bacterium]
MRASCQVFTGYSRTAIVEIDCLSDGVDCNNLRSSNSMVVTDLKHIYWRSRRGMLELELQLIPFVRDHFSSLTEQEQRCYEQMLDLEDWQLFDWVQGRETPADPLVRQVVEKIIATPAAPSSVF